MKSVKDMLEEVMHELGINENINSDEIKTARVFLDKLNKYLYQKSNTGYISEFHEYWKDAHKKILNMKVNKIQARRIALKFEEVFANRELYSSIQISPSINRDGLNAKNIANIRFFTAIQDFKIDIYKKGRDPFQEFHKHPEWFNAKDITSNPKIIHDFLVYLEATGSQGDKREKWMLNAAQFLIDFYNGEAFDIYSKCNNDVEEVRNHLADRSQIGYSRKKADMFLRDMIDWGVWKPGKNIEKLNVASDANTMRVALRSGLLELPFPLLASYLDVYCYQYSYTDIMTQEAWRTVWTTWITIENNHCPPSPASMDYLIYKSIGKSNCANSESRRKCSTCILNDICPTEKRNLKGPKSISIYGMTGWESGKTDSGGGGGIMS
ncbi:MAG: hypothetical protein ACOYEH_05860 [Caldicoprobacterales bacterium]|jgi:hypothetical protein|nr:hypothetical protein [Clostridiales bacterium]